MRTQFCHKTKSIAGAFLVGFGILIFCENLHQAAIHLSRFFGTPKALGALLTLILLASEAV